MSGLTKRQLISLMDGAQRAVLREIRGNASSGDAFARGLAGEGYAGGYKQALDDVEALLRHGWPGDPRGYWRKDPNP